MTQRQSSEGCHAGLPKAARRADGAAQPNQAIFVCATRVIHVNVHVCCTRSRLLRCQVAPELKG